MNPIKSIGIERKFGHIRFYIKYAKGNKTTYYRFKDFIRDLFPPKGMDW